MDYQEVLDEIYRWRDGLCRTRQGIDVIHAMEERIKNEPDEAKLKPLYFILAQEHEAQGNHAAAEAIYRQDPIDEVYRWHENVERKRVGIDVIRAVEERKITRLWSAC